MNLGEINYEAWKKAKKLADDAYTKYKNVKNDEEKIKSAHEFQWLYKVMQANDWTRTQEDGDVNSRWTEIQRYLESKDEQTASTTVKGEITTSGTSNDPEDNKPKRIYTQPKMNDTQDTASKSLDDMITDGETFIHDTRTSDETTIKESDIQNLSQLLYNSLLIVGVVIAVIIGGIIGIKLMISSAEEKAEVKQYLVPYVAGCIIVFGAFGIWKLVVTILQNVNL